MYTIAQIEDAIIARLEDQLAYLKTCDSLGEGLLDDLEEIIIQFPAAFVIYAGGSYSYGTSGIQDRSMEFLVILGAKNLRGDRAARHGKGAERGVYEMLEDARAALTNQVCGLDIDELLPVDEDPIETSKDMALYGIRFKTRCRFTL